MPDYSKGKIYKLYNEDDPDRCYIGSTVKTLKQRYSQHKNKNNDCVSKILFENNKTPKIELIEDYPCETLNQLLIRERFYIEQYPNKINYQIPTRNGKEYYEENKDKIKDYRKKYCDNNKDKIKLKDNKYYNANKEIFKDRSKEYYETNKEKIKDKNKEYRDKHKEEIKEYKKQYYLKKKSTLCIDTEHQRTE